MEFIEGQPLPYDVPPDHGVGISEAEIKTREEELKTFKQLEETLGSPIPALYNMFYKFIQNPSTVSVETFKRMVDTDDTIGSGVDFLTILLAARLGRYTHPNQEITKFVNDALEKIDGGWINCVKEILSGTWAGFSVTEKVWSNEPIGFIVKKLVTLPPGTILFRVERTGELSYWGAYQYQRNFSPAQFGMAGQYLFGFLSSYQLPVGAGGKNDPMAKFGDFPFPIRIGTTYSYMAVPIPTQKFIHYSFNAQGKFGNPYGRSLLRRAYKYYVLKDAFLQMMATSLDRKGTPLNVVFADPNVTVIDEAKTNRAETSNMQGRRDMGISGDIAARRAFSNVHNDTTIVLPGKKGQAFDIHTVPNDSNTQSFKDAIALCNQSIMRAMLLPSLIFTSGDGSGSYSLGQEHAKTFEKILDSMNGQLEQVLLQQLIKELIAYNFPRKVWEKDGVGSFGKRDFTNDEREKIAQMYSSGITDGYIDLNDMNDLNTIRESMGFAPRETPIQKENPLDIGDITEDEDISNNEEIISEDSKLGQFSENEWTLLATSSNESGIIKMIEKYWYSKPGSIELKKNNDQFDIYQSGKLMKDFRVITKGARFRFEGK